MKPWACNQRPVGLAGVDPTIGMAGSVGPSSFGESTVTRRQLTGSTGLLDDVQSLDGGFGTTTIQQLIDGWADETFLQKLLICLSRCLDPMQGRDGEREAQSPKRIVDHACKLGLQTRPMPHAFADLFGTC